MPVVTPKRGDARLAREALREARVRNNLTWIPDGIEALAYLHQEGIYEGVRRPDIILLDLNIPRMDGRELLGKIKSDPRLKQIPVVVLTTSQAEEDIFKAYHLNANCYISKPVDLDQFNKIVRNIEDFWLKTVRLPSR